MLPWPAGPATFEVIHPANDLWREQEPPEEHIEGFKETVWKMIRQEGIREATESQVRFDGRGLCLLWRKVRGEKDFGILYMVFLVIRRIPSFTIHRTVVIGWS